MGLLKTLFGGGDDEITSYDDFWKWFAGNERRFHSIVQKRDPAAIEKDFFPHLGSKLHQLNEGILYLVGMSDDNTAELVLTADGHAENIGIVEELVAAAPAVDGWLFTALKQPAGETFEIRMNGLTFDRDSLSFVVNEHPDRPDLVDITLVHDGLDNVTDPSAKNGAYIFLDNYLGELSFLENIDELSFAGPSSVDRERIPIDALGNFLETRRALFVEKYHGVRVFTENDEFASFQASFDDGSPLIAVMNKTLLSWDAKASHPWMMVLTIAFDGRSNNGLPDQRTYQLLDEIEDHIAAELKDADGFLNIGRETARGERNIYYACVDYREPARVAREAAKKFGRSLAINFEIFKDKYWHSVSNFIDAG